MVAYSVPKFNKKTINITFKHSVFCIFAKVCFVSKKYYTATISLVEEGAGRLIYIKIRML